tara:strand:+ start:156 stop:977 length:822 start_codon:yes stop_codon:yes gene_type:complete
MATGGSSQDILLFIPMYNCERQITRVIGQLSTEQARSLFHTVICVDNGSSDQTIESAGEALESCPIQNRLILKNDGNYNLGGSHKVAIDYARQHGFQYIVVLHGDDQAVVDDIFPYLENGDHKQLDALLGSRFMRGARRQGYSAIRTLANIIFNIIFSVVAWRKLDDLGSGLNLFRTSIFNDGFHRRYADDLTFNYYLILGLAFGRYRFRFFPIRWREFDQVSNARLVRQGLRMLQIIWCAITKRGQFNSIEHRTVQIDDYASTVVRQWGPPA